MSGLQAITFARHGNKKWLRFNNEIVVRTHSEEESQLLSKDEIGTVFFGEEELARGMTTHVLERFAREATVKNLPH